MSTLPSDVKLLPWAAEQLRISVSSAYRLAPKGKIPGAFKVGSQWRISVPRFEQLVHSNPANAPVVEGGLPPPSPSPVTEVETVEEELPVSDVLDIDKAIETQAFVYFALCQNAVIKIGWSRNPSQRMSALRKEYAATALLGCERGGPLAERQFHKRFSAERVTRDGELFRASEKLIRFATSTEFIVDRFSRVVPRSSAFVSGSNGETLTPRSC